jgi:hypothetical protein
MFPESWNTEISGYDYCTQWLDNEVDSAVEDLIEKKLTAIENCWSILGSTFRSHVPGAETDFVEAGVVPTSRKRRQKGNPVPEGILGQSPMRQQSMVMVLERPGPKIDYNTN